MYLVCSVDGKAKRYIIIVETLVMVETFQSSRVVDFYGLFISYYGLFISYYGLFLAHYGHL